MSPNGGPFKRTANVTVVLIVLLSLSITSWAQEPVPPVTLPPNPTSIPQTHRAPPTANYEDNLLPTANPGCCCPSSANAAAASPNYGGDLCTRTVLTGDWAGLRTSLANCGITFDADLVQVYQGVASGGLRQQWKYGDHADAILNIDGEKLGL